MKEEFHTCNFFFYNKLTSKKPLKNPFLTNFIHENSTQSRLVKQKGCSQGGFENL